MMLEEHDPRVRSRILETAAEYDTAAATALGLSPVKELSLGY